MQTLENNETVPLQQQLTDPATVETLGRLLDRAGELERLIDKAASLETTAMNVFAVLVDMFDEWAAELKSEGIDLERSVTQGLRAALWFGQQMTPAELDRLATLLRSDVLDESALATVGLAGKSLAKIHEGADDDSSHNQVGLLGILKALRDPNVQRSLGFAVQFAQFFGGSLPNHNSASQSAGASQGDQS